MRLSQQLVLIGAAAGAMIAMLAAGSAPGRTPGTRLGPRRRRLGVDTSARLARRRDLRPLLVRRHAPHPGRFILGTLGRRLVATEHQPSEKARRFPRRARRGDRSSVAIIGPTRCGKTVTAIGGILDWDGPAILSSVKTDLMAATVGWRRRLGDVRVFDPTQSTNESSSGWSPLRGAATIPGAQQAARALVDAGPRAGAENLDFFLRLAEQLLWPHLYLAAVNGATMRDVVRWIHTQTAPDDPDTDLAHFAALARTDPGGPQANEALHATWTLDRRTRASAYATT